MRGNQRETTAHEYADAGLPVFPANRDKTPRTDHGFKDATADHARIHRWWSISPDANVAIRTGEGSIDVLDIDRHGEAGNGFKALNQMKRAGLVEGAHALVATPGDGKLPGMHLWFRGTSQPSGHLAAQHIDLKADSAYVIAPPSRTDKGTYELLERREQTGATINWDKAKALFAEPEREHPRQPQRDGERRSGDPVHLAAWVARQPEGNRNRGTFWALCRVVEAGREDAIDAIADAARANGLTDIEIQRSIRSARQTVGRSTPEPRRRLDFTPDREAGG